MSGDALRRTIRSLNQGQRIAVRIPLLEGDMNGWHVISAEDLQALLRRVAAGEDPEMVYIEEYANASHERVPGDCSYEGEAYDTFQDFLDNEGGHL